MDGLQVQLPVAFMEAHIDDLVILIGAPVELNFLTFL